MKMLRLFFILTIGTGVLYPLTVTIIGQTVFSKKAEGSLILKDSKVIGSELLSQPFSRDDFFHPRPSQVSQASPTNVEWRKIVESRRLQGLSSDTDAWMASGSGFDPHITPKTAFSQVERIAKARLIDPKGLEKLIEGHIEGPTAGIWGQPRVNVLKLNLSLEDNK